MLTSAGKTDEICFNQSSKVFISYHRKSVSSLAKFLQAMKSTSVKIHLLWNRVGLCVLGSDCVAKERGRRSFARK